MEKQASIQLTVRGVRGSCPTPYSDRMTYGGNTSCVSMQAGSIWLICDAGTGILSVAEEIRRAQTVDISAVHIFISHLHLDHIIALPMFLADLPKQIPVHIWGVSSDSFGKDGIFRSFSETLQQLMGPPLWPVALQQLSPQAVFHDIFPGEKLFFVNNMTVTAYAAGHPDGAANFRFELCGRTVFYGLDCEITPELFPAYVEAAHGAELILFDGTYTAADYERCKTFGHSSMSLAASVRREASASQLWIMHYNNSYADDFLETQEKLICHGEPDIHFAREGMSVVL